MDNYFALEIESQIFKRLQKRSEIFRIHPNRVKWKTHLTSDRTDRSTICAHIKTESVERGEERAFKGITGAMDLA